MENNANAGTLTTSSPGVIRRWAVIPRPRLGIRVGVTPLVVMPWSVAQSRNFSWEGKGGREETIVGLWEGRVGSSIVEEDEKWRWGFMTRMRHAVDQAFPAQLQAILFSLRYLKLLACAPSEDRSESG